VRFPALNEWVRVKERKGVFLVVNIDRGGGVAGIIANNELGRVVLVPLAEILPLDVRKDNYPF